MIDRQKDATRIICDECGEGTDWFSEFEDALWQARMMGYSTVGKMQKFGAAHVWENLCPDCLRAEQLEARFTSIAS